MKKNTSYHEIVNQLETEVHLSSLQGVKSLESERCLAGKFSVSRHTLRRALLELEERDLIQREGHRTFIKQNYGNLSELGKILFVAEGECQFFRFHAIERLWNELFPLLLHKRADIQLMLVANNGNLDAVFSQMMKANVIILGKVFNQCAEQVQKLQKQRNVIGVFEQQESFLNNIVALDNIEVGRLAAKTLLDLGAKKMFALWEMFDNYDLNNRAKGKLQSHY